MGNRNDNIIEDDHADMLLRRVLEHETSIAAAPPDLVARALHRLPAEPPAQAARRLKAEHRNRLLAIAVVAVPLVLLAALNIWSVAARGPQMAFLFGNGRSGISSALLGLHLAAKPLWNTLRAANPVLAWGGLLGVVASVEVLRRLVRRIQSQYEAEDI